MKQLGFVPIELLACDWHRSPHLLEDSFSGVFVHLLDGHLVARLELFDLLGDGGSI